MKEKRQFGLYSYPFAKDARGKTFFDKGAGYKRIQRAFRYLVEEPGLGVLTSDAGVGKTAAIRNECSLLPKPDYPVIYLCDTAGTPVDIYRSLALELGVRQSCRRAQLWTDLKKAMLELVDARGNHPIVVIDEAQHLSDRFLLDLSSFLNFAFDSRELFTLWLVGLPSLTPRLRQLHHAALHTRIATEIRLDPLDRETFHAALDHGLKAAGANSKIYSDQAAEMLFRSSRGVFRIAARLLRAALRIAHERQQTLLDEPAVQAAIDELGVS